LYTALELIQKTLFPPANADKSLDGKDEMNQIKENAVKTVSIFNPNLSDDQITHSFLYLGWLIFFSVSSIMGALAPLTMQFDMEEPHNHLPGSTFQI